MTVKKTGVVFLAIIENTQIKIDNITSLQICNVGSNDVLINGVKFSNSRPDNFYTTLIVADGTVSAFELEIEFLTGGSENKLQMIYKKVIGC